LTIDRQAAGVTQSFPQDKVQLSIRTAQFVTGPTTQGVEDLRIRSQKE
jgi:hypothetical protein